MAGIIILISFFGYFIFGSSDDGVIAGGIIGNIVAVNSNKGVQKVVLGLKDFNYYPNTIKVKAGKPVSISLDESISGCLRDFTIRDFGIRKYLRTPSDTVEFTPSKSGIYRFSCSMGMYTGSFNVVDGSAVGSNSNTNTKGNTYAAAPVANNPAPSAGGSCGGSGGGCGCGGGAKNIKPSANVPAQNVPSTDNTNTQIQLIKATYSVANDIQPNNFTVKANVPVRFEILANDNGAGCMGSVALPGLAQDYYPFQQGQTAVFNFTPTQTGTYKITCAMGVPRGTITVN